MNSANPDCPAAEIDILGGLPASAAQAFLASAQTREVATDTVLFREGETARAVFALSSGYVRIFQTGSTGARIILGYLGPGAIFGTSALQGDAPHAVDAATVTRSLVHQWPAQRVRELLASQPQAAVNAIGVLELRLRDMERRLRELSNDPVEQRIASVVTRLIEKVGVATPDAAEIPFPLSRQDLADLSGTTLHTVSRTLSAWQAQGWIRRGRRHLSVVQPAALASAMRRMESCESQLRRTRKRRT